MRAAVREAGRKSTTIGVTYRNQSTGHLKALSHLQHQAEGAEGAEWGVIVWGSGGALPISILISAIRSSAA